MIGSTKSPLYSQLFSVALKLEANAAPGTAEFRIAIDGYLGAIEGRSNPFKRSGYYWRLWNAGRRAASCGMRAGSESEIDSSEMADALEVEKVAAPVELIESLVAPVVFELADDFEERLEKLLGAEPETVV